MGSRISQVDKHGNRTTVIDNLPSSQTNPDTGSLISGVGDIEFIGNTLYAGLAGAGCSHGVADIPNGVIRVNHDATWELAADLSAFQQANPVAAPNAGDFEPDGTWYSMVAVGQDLYAVEPNHGEIDWISTHGNASQVSRLIDISATQGHVVPTALTYYRGNFYVGNLGVFFDPSAPSEHNIANIWKITPSGQISLFASGFHMVLDLTFDKKGRMYVLEMTATFSSRTSALVHPRSGWDRCYASISRTDHLLPHRGGRSHATRNRLSVTDSAPTRAPLQRGPLGCGVMRRRRSAWSPKAAAHVAPIAII